MHQRPRWWRLRPLTRHAFGQQPQQILQGINWVNDGAKCLCGSYRARDVCSGLVQDVTDATRTGPVRTGQAMDQDISRLRGIVYEIKKWNEEIVGLALAHASAVVPVRNGKSKIGDVGRLVVLVEILGTRVLAVDNVINPIRFQNRQITRCIYISTKYFVPRVWVDKNDVQVVIGRTLCVVDVNPKLLEKLVRLVVKVLFLLRSVSPQAHVWNLGGYGSRWFRTKNWTQ